MKVLSDTVETRMHYTDLLHDARSASVYQTLEWLDVFKTLSCDIQFVDTGSGALIPFVCKGHSWLRRAFSLPYDTYGGPIGETDTHFSFDELARILAVPSIRLVDFSQTAEKTSWKEETASTHLVDLTSGYEQVASKYANMNRRAIRQAGRRGLRIKIVDSPAELAAFHRLYVKTQLKHGTRPLPLRFFEAIYETMVPIRMATFYVALHGGGVVAGNLVLRFKNRAYDWAWVYDEHYLYLRPTNALIDRAIRDESQLGTGLFNLGSSPSNGQGIIDFKENFGATRYSYNILTKFGTCYRMARTLQNVGRRLRA